MPDQCPAGCCPHDSAAGTTECPSDLPEAPLPERVAHLYACQALSTYAIAAVTGVSRQRVTRLLHRAGIVVKAHGAGRRRGRRAPEAQRLDQLMAGLYLVQRMPSTQIARLTGLPGRTVRARLRARGVPMRTRGRFNREDRVAVSAADLADLYVGAGLSAGEAGKLLGVSHRIVLRSAHDQGLPVRVGGPPPRRGPSEIELITALYADAQVRGVLARHGVPVVRLAGPIWERFPTPHPLTADLVTALYESCGLSLHHIELLTGRPATAGAAVAGATGIRMRPAGGRSPFIRRWREG
jgi:transposase